MFVSRTYAKFVIFISDHLIRGEVAIEFIGHHGRVTRESTFKITTAKQKLIRRGKSSRQ